jgi:ubiquinone/menaquinone biosynthesis C-methylase UbiE
MLKYPGKGASLWRRLSYRMSDFFTPHFFLACETGLSDGNKVLDYGGSIGTFALTAAKEVEASGMVNVLEDDPDALSILHKRIARSSFRNIKIHEGTYPDAIKDETLDAVVIHQRLNCMEDPDKALLAAKRVLTIGGILSIADDKLADKDIMDMTKKAGFDFANKLQHSLLFLKMYPDEGSSSGDVGTDFEALNDDESAERVIRTGKIELD